MFEIKDNFEALHDILLSEKFWVTFLFVNNRSCWERAPTLQCSWPGSVSQLATDKINHDANL